MSKQIKIYITIAFTAIIFLFPDILQAQNNLKNEKLLYGLFDKLHNLKGSKNNKINIVHIGDSHIQADFFTDVIRQRFQSRFGNGGYGFSFPYAIAKTNGTKWVNFSSNAVWDVSKNIDRIPSENVGIGGITLSGNSSNFYIDITANNLYAFNTIKVIHPLAKSPFTFGFSNDSIANKPPVKKARSAARTTTTSSSNHKVRKGETLSAIARKYGTTVAQLKKHNNLRSDNLRVGQNIRIPRKGGSTTRTTTSTPTAGVNVAKYFDQLPDSLITQGRFYSVYKSDEPITQIALLPAAKQSDYILNGVILENNLPGVIYHTIGINGAKTSDYNRCPLFFKQLPVISPDVVIISLGTNESFGKWSATTFMYQLNTLIGKIREVAPSAVIVVSTPPPSLFKRKMPNNYVQEYAEIMQTMKDCVVWDLYSKMGGTAALNLKENESLIARDKVHYTKDGYQLHGNIFAADFLNAYDKYIKNKSSK